MTFAIPSEAEQVRLGEVFDLVKNPEHWKNPIRAFVPESLATQREISDAVVFFAGGLPTVEPAIKGGITGHAVTGDGYYLWIGA